MRCHAASLLGRPALKLVYDSFGNAVSGEGTQVTNPFMNTQRWESRNCLIVCLAKTRSTCEMNDIRGGRVTSCMDDIRHSAVAEFRGGQVPGSNKVGQRPKGASWEIITRSHSHFT